MFFTGKLFRLARNISEDFSTPALWHKMDFGIVRHGYSTPCYSEYSWHIQLDDTLSCFPDAQSYFPNLHMLNLLEVCCPAIFSRINTKLLVSEIFALTNETEKLKKSIKSLQYIYFRKYATFDLMIKQLNGTFLFNIHTFFRDFQEILIFSLVFGPSFSVI